MDELKITIPEGYEIDFSKSDLFNGVIRLRKKDLTIDDIRKMCCSGYAKCTMLYASTQEECERNIVLSDLLMTAKVLNDGWTPGPNDDKYYIFKNAQTGAVQVCCSTTFKLYSNAWFKSAELAKRAIQLIGIDRLKVLF